MKKAYFKHILSLLLFGSNGIVASFILLDSYEIVFLRILTGTLTAVVLFKLFGGKFTFPKHKMDLLFISLSGVAMGTSWMFLYEAFSRLGVGISTVIYYCGPVIVMIMSPIMFKEKLTPQKIIGFIIVISGLFLINNGTPDANADVWGMICGIMSALTYFFMVTLNKKSKNIIGMENTVLQLGTGFLTVAVFMLFRQGLFIDLSGINISAVLLLGVVNTGIGCYLYFSSLTQLPVQSVAVLGYTEPLAAVLLSALLLSERMSPVQTAGAVFIIGGAMIGELIKPKTTSQQTKGKNQ